jgi:hypothetical protein
LFSAHFLSGNNVKALVTDKIAGYPDYPYLDPSDAKAKFGDKKSITLHVLRKIAGSDLNAIELGVSFF